MFQFKGTPRELAELLSELFEAAQEYLDVTEDVSGVGPERDALVTLIEKATRKEQGDVCIDTY